MKKKRVNYDQEQKDQIARLVIGSEKTLKELSEEFEISIYLLSRWKQDYLSREDAQSKHTAGLKPSEMAELIKRQQKRLREQELKIQILKKAASILSEGGV